jgi:hypothetical protein
MVRAEGKRRELLEAQPAAKEAGKIVAMPRGPDNDIVPALKVGAIPRQLIRDIFATRARGASGGVSNPAPRMRGW